MIIKISHSFFAFQHLRKTLDIFVRIFEVKDALHPFAAVGHQLGAAACTGGEDGLDFLHDIDVVISLVARLAPAHVFQVLQSILLAVEAGRPDCTDAEKLAVIKEYGATRISINPQTFSDEVLAGIGRKHSAQDILDCYAEARKAGHDDINMDLIAGLPGDTVESFERSLRQAIALDPENITVHTLTLKRASRIVMEDQKENDYADVAAMLEKCHLLAEAGYRPYYLYRQKNTLQNLENVGWCKPGHEGYYNIYIMAATSA